MSRRLLLLAGLIMVALPISAYAHWDESMPAKWIQTPDLSPMGIDVDASDQFILADDFLCTETGPITGIHIWGSWLNDYVSDARFTLSIHRDIPASQSPTGYSMPGPVLWVRTFLPGQYTMRPWAIGIDEGWMDPPDAYIFPGDHACYQYNFNIPEIEAFIQQGSPLEPIVYWLDVKAEPYEPGALFGWKTSIIHWNDDGVWGQGYEPYAGPWFELRYPPGHQMYGQSIDLAFVIAGPAEPRLDWGDAPDTYRTLAASNGANHVISGPWLGNATDMPDVEADGQPDPAALGDDNNGVDDENGVQISTLVLGRNATVTFQLSGANGFVEGWIDFNGDGIWQHPAEQIFSFGPLAPGLHAVNIVVPPGAIVGRTFARFRVSSGGGLVPFGPAVDGEVEDYDVVIYEPHKWLQGPDLSPTGIDVNDSEPYILADDFLCTEPGRIIQIKVWGSWLNDYLPFGVDPTAVEFTLSFHRDIPAWENPDGFSVPGPPLWIYRALAGQFVVSEWRSGIDEGWMDPPQIYVFPGDHVCWLYTFHIPAQEAFFQSGTEMEPIVYWLDVQARPLDQLAKFGWKTTLDHWNDDAVWGQGMEPYFAPWRELHYPYGHPYEGVSMDLAFALVNDPTSGVPQTGDASELRLYQNRPNPFAGSTTIGYSLPAVGGDVRLMVFDVTGRVVAVLADGHQDGGEYSAAWNGCDASGRGLASGVYFCRLAVDGRELTQKMMLLAK